MSAMTLREGAGEVVHRLREHGFTAYWVGGCVRDLEMGREPHDYDVATDARPTEVATLFSNAVLIGVKFGVAGVPLNGHHYEVSTFRTEGPYVDGRRPSRVGFVGAESDVIRRVFSIKRPPPSPLTPQILHPLGGRAGIARRIGRAIGPPPRPRSGDPP